MQYLAHFLPDITAYTTPLLLCTHNGKPFIWTPLLNKCFESIKSLMCRAPIPKPINPKNPETIWVICDGSKTRVGAIYGQGCYAPCRSQPGPEFGSVGFRVQADVASASGSLRRLVFRVQVLVAVKGLTRGATVSRAEGQGGYECRVEIYFTAMLFDN